MTPGQAGAPSDVPGRIAGRNAELPVDHMPPAHDDASLDLTMMQSLIDQLSNKLNPQAFVANSDTRPAAEAPGPQSSHASPLQAEMAHAGLALAPRAHVTHARARPSPAPVEATRPQAAAPPDFAPGRPDFGSDGTVSAGIAGALRANDRATPPASDAERAPFGHLALIAEAVEANRMDVYLDPILGLTDRKTRHFELSVRLRTDSGDELDAEAYAPVTVGTGLLARIDAAKLAQAADVAQRLRARGTRAALFSTLAGESLSDENFLGTFADIFQAEEGLGTKLILTFSQSDVRHFTPGHWTALASMAGIGLRFALEDVTDLDMDFSMLKRSGFDFVKLDAPVFLDGLPIADGQVPAPDICRHLASMGLGLIVGGIVAEKDLARILGFGVILGQGALFGGPRSVAIDRVRQAA